MWAIYWIAKLFTVPYFFGEIVEIKRVLPLMEAILILKCIEGVGVGDYSCRGRGGENIFLASSQTASRPRPLSSFDTHARWQPVTHSARSRRSYGKIQDCEQSVRFPVLSFS